MSNERVTSVEEQRQKDFVQALKRASPLAIPQLLREAEVQDREEALDVFDRAVKEFDEHGGVQNQFLDTTMRAGVNTVYVSLIGFFGKEKPSLQKTGLESQSFYDEVVNFRYPDAQAEQDAVADEELRHVLGEQIKDDMAQLHRPFDPTATFKREALEDKRNLNALRKRVKGQKKPKDQEFGGFLNKDNFDVDHIVPLQKVASDWGASAARYGQGSESLKKAANSKNNLAAADASDNRSKGADYNEDYVEREGSELTKKQKENAVKKSQKAQLDISAAIAKEGLGTVGTEQIGKVVVLLMGPTYYEFKEWYASKKSASSQDALQIGQRLARMSAHVLHELPRLLKEFAQELGQMIVRVFKAFVMNLIKGIFGFFKRLAGAVLEGFRIICSAVRILLSKEMTHAEKGDAVLKLLVTFVVSVVGKMAIEALLNAAGVTGALADVLSAFSTTILTALLIYGLDKLDLFAVQSERRLKRISEIFAERRMQREARCKTFTVAATEALRQQELEWATLKIALNGALNSRNMDAVNHALDGVSRLFNVEIPYSTPAEFIRFVRNNPRIAIG